MVEKYALNHTSAMVNQPAAFDERPLFGMCGAVDEYAINGPLLAEFIERKADRERCT